MNRITTGLVLSVACALLLPGCYTQVGFAHRQPKAEQIPCPDSLSDSCGEQSARDTVVIRDDRREVCYWTRNWWGEPTLRCYRTYYNDDWVSYYSDPWWYSRYDLSYGYNSCPARYYYDPYTGYCRYYRDYDVYYQPTGSVRPGSSSGSSSTGARPPRRSSEATVAPSQATTPVAPLPKESPRPDLPAYMPGGGSRANSSVMPSRTPTTAPSGSTAVPASRTDKSQAVPSKSERVSERPARSKAAPAPEPKPAPASAPSESETYQRSQEERKAKKSVGE
jgi:hypothetical protein